MNNKRTTAILNSNESKKSKIEKFTPVKIKNQRASVRASNRNMVKKMKDLNTVENSDRKPLKKHNFVRKFYTIYICNKADKEMKHSTSIRQPNQKRLSTLMSQRRPAHTRQQVKVEATPSNTSKSPSRVSRAERNARMSKSREKYGPAVPKSPQNIYMRADNSPLTNHRLRKDALRGVKSPQPSDIIRDWKCKEFDTSELLKKRKENEDDLEEIEKSIYQNIESAKSLINDSFMRSFEKEDRPISMESARFLLEKNKQSVCSAINILNEFPESSKYVESERYADANNDHVNTNMQSIVKYESSHYNSCDTQKNPSSPIDIESDSQPKASARRMTSIKKNIDFQDTLQNEESKDMIRAMSHISFTNQTEMFDNYDSGNSTLNDKSIDKLTNEMIIPDEELEDSVVLRNSFLNVTTSKNKFVHESEMDSKTRNLHTTEDLDDNYYSFQDRKTIQNNTESSKLSYVRDIKPAVKYSFVEKTERLINSRYNQNTENSEEKKTVITIDNTSNNTVIRDGWVNEFEVGIPIQESSRNDDLNSDIKSSSKMSHSNKFDDYTETVTYVSKYRAAYSK